MDKIKNILKPGHKQDTDIPYQSNESNLGSNNPTSGQGSHFGNSRTAGNDPSSSSMDPTSTPGTHGLSEPHSSRMPGTFDDDAATTASVKSGIPGTSLSGARHGLGGDTNKPLPHEPGIGPAVIGSGNTSAGPHSSSLANRADPRIDSDLEGSRGLAKNLETGTGSGAGYSDQSPGTSDLGRDTALGAGAAGAGTAVGHIHQSGADQDSGRSFPLGGNSTTASDYSAPGQVGTYPAGGFGPGSSTHTVSSTTAGPHSSSFANKADPRVDSDLDGSRGVGSQTSYSSNASGVGSGTGNDTAAGPHSANLANKADPRVHSDLDRSRGIGSNTGYGSSNLGSDVGSGNPKAVSAPHSSNIADKTDPRVDSGLDGLRTTGKSGIYSTPSDTGSRTGFGPDSWEHQHGAHGHTCKGDPCSPGETTAPGPHFTSGPHTTDTANRLDPNVAGSSNATEGIGSVSGSNQGSTDTEIDSSGVHHNRDAALAGGVVGAAGVGAHGAHRDHHDSSAIGGSSVGTPADGPAPNTAGPHKSDLINKLDPRVDSDKSKQQGQTGLGSTSAGSALGSSTTGPTDPHSSSHRGHGRDVGLTAGGAGFGGAAAYDGAQHRGTHDPSSTASTTGSATYPDSDSTGHHLGRDAGLVGAGGFGAYEAEKQLGSHGATAPDRLAGSSHQPPTTASSAPQERLAGSGHQPNVTTGSSDPHSSTGRDHHIGRDHNQGQYTALGAGASSGVGGLATHEYNDRHDDKILGSSHQPSSTKDTPATHSTSGLGPATGTGLESFTTGASDHHSTKGRDHHQERDTFLGAGMGAGAAGLAAHEYSGKDAKKLEKEQEKEAKNAAKEAHKHDKTVAKEDKHDHHHDSGEKKPGLIDRLLHRHNDDRTTTATDEAPLRDPATGKGLHPNRTGDEQTAAGTGATGLENRMADTGIDDSRHGGGHLVGNEHEHGSSSGVHATPVGSGITTHDAYNTAEGHNKLHKDPPAKILEQRGL